MDTTTAARQAGVTVATVRTWARMGAIKAVKTSGRWVIDAASLAYRISLGIRQAKKEHAVDIEIFRYPHTRARKMPKREDGKWSFRANGIPTYQLFSTRAQAEQAAASYTPPKPAKQSPAPAEQPPAIAPGWSKASRSRQSGMVHSWMESMTGLSANSDGCHYCGLDPRICDCR